MFKRISPMFLAAFIVSIIAVPVFGIEETDLQYIKISSTIDQADSLSTKGEAEQAKAKYVEAQKALKKLQSADPTWNTKVVSYRLNYLAGKIATLSKPAPAADASETPSSQPENKSAVKSAALPQGVTMKLIDAGAEPRTVLRLQPQPSDKQTMTITTEAATEMGIVGAGNNAIKMPVILTTTEVTVKDIAANGDITYDTLVKDASVTDAPGVVPQIAAALKSSYGGLKGASSNGKISNRGFNIGTEVKSVTGASPQVRQSLEQLLESVADVSCLLPDEAVGVGSKWEVKQAIKSQGMKINQTTVCQLVSIEGNNIELKYSITQSAANQKIENPSVPGMKVDLSKMTGNITGNATVDLTRILPMKASADSRTEMEMGMNVGSQKQSMTIKTDTKRKLESN